MKLIIDIPEKVVTAIQNGEDYRYDIHTTIAQGIPYEPKCDLISRNAVIRMFNIMDRYKADKLILQDTDKEFQGNEVFIVDDCYELLDLIDNAPTVDFIISPDYVTELQNINKTLRQLEEEERLVGEWINHRNDYGHNIADCNLCGKAMQWHDEDEDGIPRYCWYCGAKMKGGAE